MNALGLPIDVESLLHGRSVEWERLEFKKGWNPEGVLHTMCAFANDFHNLGGGYILIGIEERNGRPVLPPAGIDPETIDSIQKEILGLGNNAMLPAYHPLTLPARVQDRDILVIWVPGGETRPYKAKAGLSAKSSDWAWYIRKQSSTIKAKHADEQELISLTAKVPFDDRYNQLASLQDLSLRLIEAFLREVGSGLADQAHDMPVEQLGRMMNIVGGSSERAFPKNVGLMFFNPKPEQFFPATQIDVVWFPDGPGGDVFEEKSFTGPLDRMTRDALSHIERNYLKETVIKHPDRAEAERLWNYPYSAIEEAVVNAVYHRSYEDREPIEVRITPDELIVVSYPGPDRSVNMSDLVAGKAVSRRYRNRRIGEFFKELDLTEGRSTGIPKILRAVKRNGSPDPAFETDEDRTFFLVRFPVHPKSVRQTESPVNQNDHDGYSMTGEAAGEATGEATGEAVALLKVLANAPLSRSDAQKILNLKSQAYFRERYLEPALDGGLVEMTLPDSPRSPNQRYRLTGKGLMLLEKKV